MTPHFAVLSCTRDPDEVLWVSVKTAARGAPRRAGPAFRLLVTLQTSAAVSFQRNIL